MSQSTPIMHVSVASASDLSTTGQYRFVKKNTTSGKLELAGSNLMPLGILQDKPDADGVAGLVCIGGTSKLKLGGTVAIGDMLISDSSGDAVKTGAAGMVGAIAMEAGVDNDIIEVLVIHLYVA